MISAMNQEGRGIVSMEYRGKIFEGAYEVRGDMIHVCFGSRNKIAHLDSGRSFGSIAQGVLGDMVMEAGY